MFNLSKIVNKNTLYVTELKNLNAPFADGPSCKTYYHFTLLHCLTDFSTGYSIKFLRRVFRAVDEVVQTESPISHCNSTF